MPNEEKVEEKVGGEIGELEQKMDELLEQNQSKGDEKDVQKKDSQDGGWITSLPKELRAGVDSTKYSSLGDYIKDLRANQKDGDTSTVTKEKVEEEWSALLGEAKKDVPSGFDGDAYDSIVESLKKDGVDVVSARKTLEAFSRVNGEQVEKMKKAKDETLSKYVTEKWGANAKEYLGEAKKGLQVIFGENKELIRSAQESGLSKDPAFLEVCKLLGRTVKEGTIETPKNTSNKKTSDPLNPLGL